MNSGNFSQRMPNLIFIPHPMKGRYPPIWDARQISSPVNLGFRDADSREFQPMDIPFLLQLQVDRGIRFPSLPLTPGMRTPLSRPYPSKSFVPATYPPPSRPYSLGSGRHPIRLEYQRYPSQPISSEATPETGFKCLGPLHGRPLHHHHHSCFNVASVHVSHEPFTESSILRVSSHHSQRFNGSSFNAIAHLLPLDQLQNALHVADPSESVSPLKGPVPEAPALYRVPINGRDVTNTGESISIYGSQSRLQTAWSREPGETDFIAESKKCVTGLPDLHLRAPGARIVIDGVDYTSKLGGTSQGNRNGKILSSTTYDHDCSRSFLVTRGPPYQSDPRLRNVRPDRVGRDSNDRVRLIFSETNSRDDSHTSKDHNTHDLYLQLLNESATKRLFCRPTPLHSPFTFGPAIFADSFHEIAVDENGMVVIREIESALPLDRRYPNCLCGKPMDDEEIEGGWRLCLQCHEKVGDERELVEVAGRPCLRDWLKGGGEGFKPWTGMPGAERHDWHDNGNNHGQGNANHDASRAGPSRDHPFEESMELDEDITQKEIWLLAADPRHQNKEDKGQRKEIGRSSIASNPELAGKIKPEQMRNRIQEDEHANLYAKASYASSQNRATLPQFLMDLAHKNYQYGEQDCKKKGEADFQHLQKQHTKPHSQMAQHQSQTEHARREKGKFAARCEDAEDEDESQPEDVTTTKPLAAPPPLFIAVKDTNAKAQPGVKNHQCNPCGKMCRNCIAPQDLQDNKGLNDTERANGHPSYQSEEGHLCARDANIYAVGLDASNTLRAFYRIERAARLSLDEQSGTQQREVQSEKRARPPGERGSNSRGGRP